jgi:hydrogenase maturation protein HypF
MAVSHLLAADRFGPPVGVVADLAARHAERWEAVAELARTGVRSPTTSSAGRLFDAVAALCGAGDVNTYEGQAAGSLERLAARAGVGHPPYEAGLDENDDGLVLLGADLIRAVVDDLATGTAPEEAAARFHAGLAALTTRALVRLRARTGLATVACSGGVFQNAVFAGALARRLRAEGFTVVLHRRVPPNDGGISLGQVAVAAALA